MANLGENLWKNFDAGKVASIRAARIQYVARCQSRLGGKRYAAIQIECRDSIGHPFSNHDLCPDHAKPILERAERLKKRRGAGPIIGHEEGPC